MQPRLLFVLCGSLLQFGCTKPAERSDSPSSAQNSPPANSAIKDSSQETPAPTIARSRTLMSTIFRIETTVDPQIADPAIEKAFDEIERLQHLLSEWEEASEISEINRLSGVRAVKVGPEVFTVIKTGVEVSKWSNGAFDLSWAALHGLYEFSSREPKAPSLSEIKKRVRLINWRNIQVDEKVQTTFLLKKGMALGTGGITKGYALDRAAKILRDAGVQDFIIFGGGQIQVSGKRGARPWRVGIQHPRDGSQYIGKIEGENISIATSGDYEHFFIDEQGNRWHHIIDPLTGFPATRSISVTIIASSGIYADALSKPVFIFGPDKGLAFIAKVPFDVGVVIVDAECRIHLNDAARKYVTLNNAQEKSVLGNCLP